MILSDFDGGRSLHETQHFSLGQEVYDSQGNRWGYVQIDETSSGTHRLLRSTKHSDIMSAGNGDVSAAQAVGTNRIRVADTDNADFTGRPAARLEGALGVITAAGGRGQRFWIKRRISDHEVEVEVLDNDTGKWEIALTTSSKFYLWFPGLARRGDGLDDFIEGVLHANAVSADIGKFGFVQRSGLGLVTLDNSATALGQGKSMIPNGGGLVEGLDGTPDEQEISAVIGRALSDTSETTHDAVILAMLDIPAPGVSFKGARTNNPYNRVVIGSN